MIKYYYNKVTMLHRVKEGKKDNQLNQDCHGAMCTVQDSHTDVDSGPIGCCIMVITEVGTLLTTTCYHRCTCMCQSFV